MSAVNNRRPLLLLVFKFFLISIYSATAQDDLVFQAGSVPTQQFGPAKQMRYLLFDVNPGEGFNLRRDVYIRVANLIKVLNDVEPWTLVLPPWGNLYHWQSDIDNQMQIPWSEFFDLESLNKLIPVIEFEDYLKVHGHYIDEVYYMQNYANWKVWEEKVEISPCKPKAPYEKENNKWRGQFFGYRNVYARSFECLSTMAEATFMKSFLLKKTKARSVMFDRAESLIHGGLSEWSREWWTARRSMRFSKQLRDVADKFRQEHLDSTDEKDGVVFEEDWTQMTKKSKHPQGGPYLAVHMRRKDFLYGHSGDVPSIAGTAKQITAALREQNLNTVFVATDAPDEEFKELKEGLGDYKVIRYEPSEQELKKYKDGGIAIIDQWICAHARHFIGTSVSTFSFRIHEERQIMGFKEEHTYNRLCGDGQGQCEQPSKWPVMW